MEYPFLVVRLYKNLWLMEIAQMDYRFTAILILMLSALAFFAEPAYPHNKNSNTYINKDFIKKWQDPY